MIVKPAIKDLLSDDGEGWQRLGKEYDIRALSNLLSGNNGKNKDKIRYLGSVEIAERVRTHWRERGEDKNAYKKGRRREN